MSTPRSSRRRRRWRPTSPPCAPTSLKTWASPRHRSTSRPRPPSASASSGGARASLPRRSSFSAGSRPTAVRPAAVTERNAAPSRAPSSAISPSQELKSRSNDMFRALDPWIAFALAIGLAIINPAQAAQPSVPGIGIVVMHGKGGSPDQHVASLASALEQNGYLVANLEMAWSGRREYDVSVDAAAIELGSALDMLRSRGAKKLFVAGHSLGALFALYYAGKNPVDGVIAIAPGGSVNVPVFRQHLAASVERARRLVSEGKAGEKTRFDDYEGARGTSP